MNRRLLASVLLVIGLQTHAMSNHMSNQEIKTLRAHFLNFNPFGAERTALLKAILTEIVSSNQPLTQLPEPTSTTITSLISHTSAPIDSTSNSSLHAQQSTQAALITPLSHLLTARNQPQQLVTHTKGFSVCSECNHVVQGGPYDLCKHMMDIHHKIQHLCDICRKIFKHTQSLKNHNSTYHNYNKAAAPIMPQPTQTPTASFADHVQPAGPDNINQHSIQHQSANDTSDTTCAYCNQVYENNYDLCQHIVNKHHKSQPVCDICNSTFKNMGSLKNHNWRYHKYKDTQ